MIMMRKPGVVERARSALRFFRYGWASVPAHRKEQQIPLMWPTWRQGQPQWQITDYASYAQEGFNTNALIYSAIMYKVRSITSAPLRAYEGTFEEPELLPADHPLQKLAMRPNRHMSGVQFQGLNELYFNLSGNCYIYAKRARSQTVPEALYTLRPDQMYIVPKPSRSELLGYWYVPEGKPFSDGIPYLAQDIIHVKLPNPLDPLDGLGYGLSPISCMARSADVDNEITRYLKLFFEQGAMPPGLLSFEQDVDDTEIARIRERWKEIYGGVDNWTDVGVLGKGGKYQKIGLTFAEMGFEVLDGRNENRMASPFGVPLTLIESRRELVSSTYSNKETDREMFWQDTMVPELHWFEMEFQYYLQGDHGEFVMFDLKRVPALLPKPTEQRQAAMAAFKAGGILRNEFRSALGFNPVKGGDVYLLPLNVVEVPLNPIHAPEEGENGTQEGMPEAEEEAEENETAGKIAGLSNYERNSINVDSKEDDALGGVSPVLPAGGAGETKVFAFSPEQKLAHWKAMDSTARAWEPKLAEAAGRAFETDKREILSLVHGARKQAIRRKATVAWNEVLLAVTEYLGMAEETWRKEFAPVIAGAVEDRVNQINTFFQIAFSVTDPYIQQFIDDYTFTFAQPILATTGKDMNALFNQAMAEGWSVETTAKHLEAMFQQYMHGSLSAEEFAWFAERMPFGRREMIARTESIRISTRAARSLYKAWGVTVLEWYTAEDRRVCQFCREMHEKIVGINDDFWKIGDEMTVMVDGKPKILRFTYEDVKSPPLHPDCRCDILPAGL